MRLVSLIKAQLWQLVLEPSWLLVLENNDHVEDNTIEQDLRWQTCWDWGTTAIPEEVSDNLRYVESWMDEISNKAGRIDVVNASINGLAIRELVLRVETLEDKVKRTDNFRCGENSSSLIAHMEERVEELDTS